MGETITLKKGLDIKLKGEAEKQLVDAAVSKIVAVKPTDFSGIIPKLTVKPGAMVKAGTVLFFDKNNPDIKFTSPVSGTVKDVVRGERRRMLQVLIEADSETKFEDFKTNDLASLDAEKIKEVMLSSGVWPFMMQRPYAVIANPSTKPKSIFISAFDSAPLGVDYDFVLEKESTNFQKGIDVLAKLTDGKVHLNVDGKKESSFFNGVNGVELNKFIGKHPAGTIGTQINKIDPINKGEFVWYMNPQDVVILGRLFAEGKYDAKRIVALAGSEVENPKYYNTILGADMSVFNEPSISKKENRVINGNVLTGEKADEYLSFYNSLVSVIPEGDYYEFFGWILPRFKKFSMSKSYFSWLMPNKEYALDTNVNGGDRAFVVTGQYEKVVPMDILPTFLLKACLAGDIDKMEQLGIYEVAEEDLALCEFVCTSKIEVQSIIRDGINLMIKELS